MLHKEKCYEINIENIKNNEQVFLKSDIAGEYPIYLYLSPKRDYVLYSKNIKKLLNHKKVIKPLKIKKESISFLLQNGVVPLPQSIYENMFILSIGDIAIIKKQNNVLDIEFKKDFPFFNKFRGKEEPDKNKILGLLGEAIISRIDENNPTFLFHSAGKDSNMIALALKKIGFYKDITFLSFKATENEKDESEISKTIAEKLGYKHLTLTIPKSFNEIHKEQIINYFREIPFPVVDNATLAYPLYSLEVNFTNSNVIDGSGNDVYLGYIPLKSEFIKQKYFSILSYFDFFNIFNSESIFNNFFKSKAEWAGLNGFNFMDSKKIYFNSINSKIYWRKFNKITDYFDLRSFIRGKYIEQGMFIKKTRNFSRFTNANLVLPWTNEKLANYFMTIDEKYLFDRKYFKNKLILRKILKEELGLDSDKIGKKSYSFDYWKVLELLGHNYIKYEILKCELWNKKGISELLDRLYSNLNRNNPRVKNLIHRLFLISMWFNYNKWIR